MLRLLPRRALAAVAKRHSHIAAVVHDQLVTLPHNRRSIILPGDVGLAYNDLLSTFRDALSHKHPDGIYSTFVRLQNAGHADNLGPEDIRAIDTIIASTVWKPFKQPSMLQPATHRKIPRFVDSPEQYHDIALWLAIRGQSVLLRACMIRALLASNPKPVIAFWNAYAERSLVGEGTQNLEELPHPTPQPQSDSPTLLPYYPGRPELLALTICAYTMLGDFRSAFHTVNQTLIPINTFQARDALEPLVSVQEKAVFDAIQNVSDLTTLRMLARPASLRNHIIKAVETKSHTRVQQTFDSIVKLLRAPDPWIGPLDDSSGPPTINTLPDAKPLFSVSRQTWCDMIEAASNLHVLLPDLTQSIWAEIYAHNAKPTTGMWNALLMGYATRGDFKRAWAVWDEMGENSRDVYTYTSMIQALFERREPEEAIKLFEQLKAFARERGEELDIRPYNVLLHGLFTSGRIQTALELLSQLCSPKPDSDYPAPDITTFNTQLRFYARKRDMVGLSAALKTMADRKAEPDAYTFVTILDALLGVGSRDTAKRLLDIMQALGVEPNAAIVNALIEDIVRTRPPPKFTKSQQPEPHTPLQRLHIAVKFLLAFEQEGKVETNVVNYTALMAAFQRAAALEEISHADALNAIKALRERMRKRDIAPNRVTFNVLINAALEGGRFPPSQWSSIPVPPGPIDQKSVPLNVSQAVKYLHDMRGMGVLPNHDTWWLLLKGVASWGQIKLARTLCDEMLETGFVPQTGLFSLILKIRGGK
ncbi:PPR containing plant-like protein [Ceratobasidium sp. AG-Ba]|nr:PPR containing plant-like protein [Ceratobasidium sp. AG-Ba]